MESMNKFKALTIMIICVFVFAIAAMYVNTKDATEQRNQERPNQEQEENYNARANNSNKYDTSDLAEAIRRLDSRVNELETNVAKNAAAGNTRRYNAQESDGVRCQIYGTKIGSGRIEMISPDAALQDARINGNDLVLTCSLG